MSSDVWKLAVPYFGERFLENFGAGDRGRTGDVQLGKLAFYH